MKFRSTQVSIPTVLLWLMLVFCDTTATQMTSCDHQDPVSCSSSGVDENCENVKAPDKEQTSHSCGDKHGDMGKEKYILPNISPFRGVYTFPVDPMPRRNCFDEEAMEFLQEGLPVVLENCTFHKSAMKWTIKYLVENLQDENHTAYFSTNRKFLYFDDDRIKGAYKDWKPPTSKMLLYFKNFSELMGDLDKADNGSRAYFQSMLYLQDGVSESMLEDINSFNYTWLLHLVRRLNWGEEVTNLLLVGMQDVVTPAHFDILENLYVQIFGRKRVILFSPDCFRYLYPYPIGHPHDRQTQVDFDKPDLIKFPRFGEIRGMEVTLEPDEVLYIPNYWWHYIESESQSKTISMNFWFDPKNETKTDNMESSQNSNTTSDAPEKEKKGNQDEKGEIIEAESQSSTNPEEIPELTDEGSKKSVEEDSEGKENKNTFGNEGKESEEEKKEEKNEEDDEEEKFLTAAQYLALLRDTEVALFRATLSHEKVKQILEDLLTRRFDYLSKS